MRDCLIIQVRDDGDLDQGVGIRRGAWLNS